MRLSYKDSVRNLSSKKKRGWVTLWGAFRSDELAWGILLWTNKAIANAWFGYNEARI